MAADWYEWEVEYALEVTYAWNGLDHCQTILFLAFLNTHGHCYFLSIWYSYDNKLYIVLQSFYEQNECVLCKKN